MRISDHLSTFRKRRALPVLLAAALASASAGAAAQDYPTRPLRLVVPYSPGGTSDFIGRLLGQKLTESWKQSVVVENRAGANGNIGTELVAKSAPDGYTLLLAARAITINQSLYTHLSFDAVRDFAPVTTLLTQSLVLTVHPSLPVKTVGELLTLARARPGELLYSSGGSGNVNHIAAELLQSMAKIRLTHVPYKSMAPGISALLGGEVHLTFATLISVAPHYRSGRLRALAATSHARSPALPDVPTLDEAGLRGYEEGSWVGIFAPAKTPPAVVAKLNQELVRIMHLPDVAPQIQRTGAEVATSSPEEFASLVRADVKKYAALIRTTGIRVD